MDGVDLDLEALSLDGVVREETDQNLLSSARLHQGAPRVATPRGQQGGAAVFTWRVT